MKNNKNNSNGAPEPALPWAHVPLFVPALAILGSAAIAVSALAIFAPADKPVADPAIPAPSVAAQTLVLSLAPPVPTVAPRAPKIAVETLIVSPTVPVKTMPVQPVAVETLIVSPAAPARAENDTRIVRAALATSEQAFVRAKMRGRSKTYRAFQNAFAKNFAFVSFEMPADLTSDTPALFSTNAKIELDEFLPAPVKPETDSLSPTTAVIQLPLPKPVGKQPITMTSLDSTSTDGHIGSVAALDAHFEQIDYDLANVRELGNNVPRLYLKQLPADIADVTSVETRKRVFIKAILPVVLRVNEDILAAREKLRNLRGILDSGMSLTDDQRKWLYEMADRYETDPYDWDAFMARVDIIPPSLAIAQAAEESGWGTSRFAREGNALFGQYTFAAANGMLPEERASGRRHLIRAYSSLVEGVRSYMHNLNYHRAYREFRGARKWLRDRSKPIDGDKLAGELLRYSERGAKYVKTIRTIMRANNLAPLDDAQLHDDRWTQDEFGGADDRRS
jgi:Bax protein